MIADESTVAVVSTAVGVDVLVADEGELLVPGSVVAVAVLEW